MIRHELNDYAAIQPAHPDFRNEADIASTFTWEDGIKDTGEEGLYVVRFRSQRDPELPEDIVNQLIEHDKRSFREANYAFPGQLLLYWCDDVSPNGLSLSTCVWTEERHAKAALYLPDHQAAVRFMHDSEVYDWYNVSAFNVHKTEAGLAFTAIKNRPKQAA